MKKGDAKKLFQQTFLSLIFCSVFQVTEAQMPGGMPGGNMQAPPNLGHIYGKVIDGNNKPLTDVSVMLLQTKYDTVKKKNKELLFKAQITKTNGEFDFDELPLFGNLKLKILALDYSEYDSTISFAMKINPDSMPKQKPANMNEMPTALLNIFNKNLGSIKLSAQTNQLKGITVTTAAPTLQLLADKKVFNVTKDLVSAGGTAQDVMKNVPSVLVDIDGNVTLRNATPQIYVDGRPTTLALDQIPADAIDNIEIITNPSAKYDASGGGAGILNIVLKKNRKTGYNGNLRLGVDRRGGVNGGGDLNARQGKVNLSASVMTMLPNSKTTGYTDRYNFSDTPETHVYQTNYNKTHGGILFGRLGADWFVTDKTTISAAVIKVHGSFKPDEQISIHTDSLYNSGTTFSNSIRNSTSDNTINMTGAQLSFKQLFKKEGEELTADINYNAGKNTNNALYVTNYYDASLTNLLSQQQQRLTGNGKNTFYIMQTDYTKPIGAKGKLEAGLRASIRDVVNNSSSYLYDDAHSKYVLLPSTTSNYKNSDKVYAAYTTYSNVIKKFNYQIGLRAESSSYTGSLTNTGEKFSNKYPLSLFPSLFLSEKLKANQELQFNFSRRINRPTFFQLLPVTDYTDNLNITRGNPDLKPEFTYSAEISYLKTYQEKNSFLASVYYKRTVDLITRYQQQEISPVDSTNVLVTTYINANNSYNYGLELTSQNYITKWWDGSLNINLYNSKINAGNVTGTNQNALFSYFGKLNNNFKLPENFTIQLSGVYQSKTNIPANSGGGFDGPGGGGSNKGGGGPPGGGPFGQSQTSSQGYIKANYGVDAAIRKSFLKNNAASVSISVNDIFRTRKTEQYSYSDYFTQTYSRLRDPQMVRVNLNYRFGKVDTELFKRKNLKSQTESEQNATEGVQF